MRDKPRSGDRCPGRRAAAYAAAENLPPLRGFLFFVVLTLGLTPQAKYLSRLRRFVQPSAPFPRSLGRQRGKTPSSFLGVISDQSLPPTPADLQTGH